MHTFTLMNTPRPGVPGRGITKLKYSPGRKLSLPRPARRELRRRIPNLFGIRIWELSLSLNSFRMPETVYPSAVFSNPRVPLSAFAST